MINKHIKKLQSLEGKNFWKYFLKHKEELKLILDNDDTIVVTKKRTEREGDDEDYACVQNYIGDSDGIIELLGALSINCERC